MPTWVQVQTPKGSKLVLKEKVKAPSLHIMPDIEPYQAVAGKDAGRYITSRSHERTYLRDNNCIQVGNERETFFKYNGKTEDNPTKDWQ